MDFIDYFAVLRRRWRVIGAFVLVGIIAAALIPTSSSNTDRFSATHELLFTPRGDTGSGAPARAETQLEATAALATGEEVSDRVAKRMGFTSDPGNLADDVEVQTDPKAAIIAITAVKRDRSEAALLANTYASELQKMVAERDQATYQEALTAAKARADQLREEVRAVSARLATAPLAQAGVLEAERDAMVGQYSVAFERYQQLIASPPNAERLSSLGVATPSKVSPGLRPPRSRPGRMALAAVLGLLLGAGAALIAERSDTRVRTKEEAEEAFDLPVLAEIPPFPVSARHRNEVATHTKPNSAVAESYRTLRASLLLMQRDQSTANGTAKANGSSEHDGIGVVLVSSANPAEGKTTTAANLAATLAEAGKQVLVVDCDFRHPRLGHLLGADDRAGLSDVLRGGPRLADVVNPTNIPGVAVVTSGTVVDNPAELFALEGESFIAEARRTADIVILDTPPLLAINDATELVPFVDAVVLVCRAGRTPANSAVRVSELLRRLGAPTRGVVLVGATETAGTKGYYAYYYHSQQQNRPVWQRFLRRQPAPVRSAGPASAVRPTTSSGSGRKGSTSNKKKGKRQNRQGAPAVSTRTGSAVTPPRPVAPEPAAVAPPPTPVREQPVQQTHTPPTVPAPWPPTDPEVEPQYVSYDDPDPVGPADVRAWPAEGGSDRASHS